MFERCSSNVHGDRSIEPELIFAARAWQVLRQHERIRDRHERVHPSGERYREAQLPRMLSFQATA